MAGSAYPGRNVYVGIGIQNGFAAGSESGATVYTYYEPDDIRGVLEEYTDIASNRRLNSRFRGAGYIGTKSVPFGMTFECNPMNVGRILKLAFGTETCTVLVTAQSATHKFYPAEDLSYATIYVYTAGVAENSANDRTHKIMNWKLSRLTLEGGLDNVIRVTIEGTGTDRFAVTSPTTSFTTVRPFFLNSEEGTGIVSIGDAIGSVSQFDECRSFRFEIDNAVSLDHRVNGSASASAVREGDSQVTGSFDCVYNANTFAEVDKFADGDDRAFELEIDSVATFITAQTYELKLQIEKARYTGTPPSWDPDVISLEMPYIGELASDQAISITLTNSDVVAYTYSV